MTQQVVTVLGVGALGSHVVQLLRNLNVHLRCVDFDRVEMKNLASQFHAKKSVGASKVRGLQQVMQFLFDRKIEAIPHRLKADNSAALLQGSALILDCLDNYEARSLIQAHIEESSQPCLHGALAPDGQFGRVIWHEHFVADHEGTQGAATCENGAHLPFIAIVASYMAFSAQTFLEQGRKVGFQVHPGGVVPV